MTTKNIGQALGENGNALTVGTHMPQFVRDQRIVRNVELLESRPHGGGFDRGTTLLTASDTKLCFETWFHHMDEFGVYDGWTQHYVTVKPTFSGYFDIKVTGSNRNNIRDYVAEVFAEWLDGDAEETTMLNEEDWNNKADRMEVL